MGRPKLNKELEPVEAAEAVEDVAKKPVKRALKQYKITFHGEGGDVVLGHNHKINLYKRNVETTIDELFLGALRSAVVETEIEDADGKRKKVRIPQEQYTVEVE